MELLRCGLLLQLPDDLETRFWNDAVILRKLTNWDVHVCLFLLCANLVLGWVLKPLLRDVSLLPHTWHLHFIIIANLLSCTANLVLIFRHRQLYKRHRHRIVLAQRVLRLVYCVLTVLCSSEALLAAQADALNKHAASGLPVGAAMTPTLATAVSSLTRPLSVAAVTNMAHGSWVLRTKVWLPFQVVTVVLTLINTQRHQHCRMVNDANSALLLQPTCRAMSDFLQSVAGSLLGPVFLGLQPMRPLTNEAACKDTASAARMLAAYANVVYVLLVQSVGVCTMEWRLKARWAREKLGGRQLVYGPFGNLRSTTPTSLVSRLLSLLAWMRCVAVLWLLWILLTWLVPRLPHLPCSTCEDKGTCHAIAPCDYAVCKVPGHLTALVMHANMLVVHLGNLVYTYSID